jgi:hypothetical protein
MLQTFPGAVTPLGCFNVTLTNAAQTLDALIKAAGGSGLPAGARHFVIMTEGAAGARWTDSTTGVGDPTTTTGIQLPGQVPFEVWNADGRIGSFKFCRDGGVNVTASLWVAK